jgi:hypothetical protein
VRVWFRPLVIHVSLSAKYYTCSLQVEPTVIKILSISREFSTQISENWGAEGIYSLYILKAENVHKSEIILR